MSVQFGVITCMNDRCPVKDFYGTERDDDCPACGESGELAYLIGTWLR